MKLTKLLLLIFVFVISLTSLSFAQLGSISGTVMSETDSLPIFDASVIVFNQMNPLMTQHFSVQTDSNGFYEADSLPQGQYRVYVMADSFVAEFYDNAYHPMLSTPIKVGPNTAITDIDFYLIVGGVVSGIVLDAEGNGIANAIVTTTPFEFYPTPGCRDSLLGPQYGYAITDKDGLYQINTLKTGKYRIAATISDHRPPLVQYWENTYDYTKATPVEVTAEQTVNGINFKFDYKTPSGVIAGKATDINGNPLKNIWVVAWEQFNPDSFHRKFRGFHNITETNENGEYEIDGLRAGYYRVSATRWDWWNYQTVWYDQKSTYNEADSIKVADETVTGNIDFVFGEDQQLGAISGKVVADENGSPIANAYVEAMYKESSYVGPTVRPRPAMFAFTDQDGNYKIDMLLEREYYLLVHKNGYTEFYDNVQKLKDATPVKVKSGEDTKDINFSIPANLLGSKISGIVTDETTGQAIPHAFITVFSTVRGKGSDYWGGHFTLFDFYGTIADNEGKYTVSGLPAGEYIVACWARNYIAEFYDNKKLNPWRADRIMLDGTEEKTSIDFALTPGWGFDFHGPKNDMSLGTISGKIFSDEGGINGAYVYAIDENQNVQACEMTGPDGQYTLGGIPAGEYYVMASRMPYETEYYSESTETATDISQATPVAVGEAGEWDATETDVQLAAVQTTAVENEGENSIPTEFSLMQNYPNPFNPSTTIHYALPQASHVTLKIFNLRGELVRTLVDGEQPSKLYQVTWDGKNDLGQKVSAGIYLYQLKAGDYNKTMRLLFLK